jgi:hypothetical protein
MSAAFEAARRFIGMESQAEFTCDAVERGAVRRYAQAIMDEDPIYDGLCDNNAAYGGPVAPPLYPVHLIRRGFGEPDAIQQHAGDPAFDGLGPVATQGLPEIEPLKGYALLNGGTEIEFLRYARHGERVQLKSRYADITEKQTSKGAMILVTLETEYRNGDGDLLVRFRRTLLRRP